MEKYFLQSLGPSLYRGSTVLENAVGINIIGTLLYCWVVMCSVYRAPKGHCGSVHTWCPCTVMEFGTLWALV